MRVKSLARFDGARFYCRTMGFCAVFPPGSVQLGEEWGAHPVYDDTFTSENVPELIVSRPDDRLILGRCGKHLDMKYVRRLSSQVFGGVAPVAVRVAPLAVALPLHGSLPFELSAEGLHCRPIPIRDQEHAHYGEITLQTHVTAGRRSRGSPLRVWLETTLVDSAERHLHYVADLRRLTFVRQGNVPNLIATMIDEVVRTEHALDDLKVDSAFRCARTRLGVARVTPDGVAVDVRLPSPGADLKFTALNGNVLPRGSE